MSHWLLNFFAKDQPKNKEDVDSIHFISRILEELKEIRTPLMITFRSTSEHELEQCVSMVINVDLKNKQVILDEFSTKKAHELALNGERFKVETSENGISVVFYSQVLTAGKREGIAFYQLDFPDHLEYHQRREAFRAKINASANTQVHFKNKEGLPIKTKLQDLSHTGMGLAAPGNLENSLKFLDIVERCTFSPYEGCTITCKFQIRRVYYDTIKQTSNVGCQFLELSQDQQRLINKVVSDLQREARKRENRME